MTLTDSTADVPGTAPTGERFDPALMGDHLIEAEHFARYSWAAQFAPGRRVLDAACGMAYGTAILAAAGAVQVIGVDLDPAVIAKAEAGAPPGASFRVGDLRKLPFEDGEFDLVVCFEAIEHVAEPELALDEMSRVLGEGGVLVVSTPNRDVYAPGNPFHLRELTPNELEDELQARFRSVSLRRQHTWIASAVLDDEAFETGENAVIDGIEVRKVAGGELGTETYTVGLASDADLPLGNGVVDLTSDIDIRDWSFRLDAADLALAAKPEPGGSTSDAEVSLLRRELTELRRQLIRGESEMSRFADLEARLTEARGALGAHEALQLQFDELAGRHEGLQRAHQQVVHSSSWRLTAPLRRLTARLRSTS
jgi:SAM-dependent methyltransferase